VQLMVHEQIEELRLQMQEIASDKELTDPRVVSVSERLDLLINEFYLAKRTSILTEGCVKHMGTTRPLIYERGQQKMDYEKMWNELECVLNSHKSLSNKKTLNLMNKINMQQSAERIKNLLKPLRKTAPSDDR